MDNNLQHEDLLIQLRGKLNEEKVKLWEPPYYQPSCEDVSSSLQDLAKKYSSALAINYEPVLNALHELQIHSLERNKANNEFKETGLATFRIKANAPGKKPCVIKVQKKLDALAKELAAEVAKELEVAEDRIKLIFNGRVLKPAPTLEAQGVKNGSQIMALVMTETPETERLKKEETMYMEMKSTKDDAMLLSEYVDDLADDDEYMKLEDQAGNTVELPPAERRSLLVGLALHERGRAAIKQRDFNLALVLLLEADRQFDECRSSILATVDNWALLQLDIAWCYLQVQALSAASDAATRLQRAEEAFARSYGTDNQRVIALKGTAANERVLLMRLYLLQGIVAYHQNKRAEARRLMERAENELNLLRVDETAVTSLMELGWSRGQARAGLRAAGGSLDAAHHYLHEKKQERDRAREQHRMERQRRALGLCEDGSPVNQKLVEGLQAMGYSKELAIVALRNSNNHVAEAVRLIQEQPEMSRITNYLQSWRRWGYLTEEARTALRVTGNVLNAAIDLLVTGGGHVQDDGAINPSTSAGGASKPNKSRKRNKSKRRAREQAWQRLSSAIRGEEDDHLHGSLQDEETFLGQYKSLL
ncbi:hypothetical protein O0L34_g10337 [Tuta absoluta]|nr:hypothetical protein O0L34_g10337 [Tuta absoluta]